MGAFVSGLLAGMEAMLDCLAGGVGTSSGVAVTMGSGVETAAIRDAAGLGDKEVGVDLGFAEEPDGGEGDPTEDSSPSTKFV